jgi:capsular polysaccharide transport system permease protein
MTSTSVAKTSRRIGLPTRPDEERIGQRYDTVVRRRSKFVRWLFLIMVVAPTAVATAYFGFLAAPRYVSETQFIVRSVDAPQGAGSFLETILQAVGITRSQDDSNAVMEYLQSRDAVSALEGALPLRKMFSREEADWAARFPRPFFGDSFERLYWYYQDRVSTYIDPDSGIVTLRAQAFRPDDAQAITRQLLSQAEGLVNKMNERLEADTVRTAEASVAEAQKAVLAAQEDVDRFRETQLVVDPGQNAVAQLTTITQLSAQVDQVLAQIQASLQLSPSNPTAINLKAQANALSEQVAREQKALAGSHDAVSGKVSTYDRLTLVRSLADASLAAARLSLDNARTDARRQHVFVEEIATPNLPDYATEPEAARSVASVFEVTLAAFFVLWLASIGVKERAH